jgi:hypothetical protein
MLSSTWHGQVWVLGFASMDWIESWASEYVPEIAMSRINLYTSSQRDRKNAVAEEKLRQPYPLAGFDGIANRD